MTHDARVTDRRHDTAPEQLSIRHSHRRRDTAPASNRAVDSLPHERHPRTQLETLGISSTRINGRRTMLTDRRQAPRTTPNRGATGPLIVTFP